ncbi:MAG TPA: RNase adapter RapZ [Candidatus Dormibacteraeota bacterium]|nr:RNase adapter RapZ [Candidatus Dormibacteraeota bacterium]
MTLVMVGGPTDSELDEAVGVFIDSGFQLARWLTRWDEADAVLPLRGDAVSMLKDADAQNIRYVLVHVGAGDGRSGGSHDRAHHRVDIAQLRELAQQLRSRERLLITCLAFGYKNGIPDGASWVVDARLLENPYWVDELRPLDGHDPRVRDYVINQQAAQELLGNLDQTLRAAIPHYRERGRSHLVVAFGCTGGRHRSVAMAEELAARLKTVDGIDVEFTARDLGV